MRLAMGYLDTCVKGIIPRKFTQANDFRSLAALSRNFSRPRTLPAPPRLANA
jgi:hypothetical protein